MKKIMTTLLVVVLLVSALSLLVGCGKTTYTITYHIEGAVDTPNPSKYSLSRDDLDLWYPQAADGYTFDGWYVNADYSGRKIDYIANGTTGNKEYYGRFYRNSGYSITYVIDGEEREDADSNKTTYTFSNNAMLLWVPPEVDGKSFVGWFDTDGEITGDSIKKLSIPKKSTGDLTLYGFYEEITTELRSITYIVDGETKTGATPSSYYKSVSRQELWIPSFNSDINGFDGWYESEDYTGTKFTTIPSNTDKDLVLYGRLVEPDGWGDAMGRKKAPDFALYYGTEDEISRDSLIGKPVLLNFWSSKCGPCRTEMPDIEAAYKEQKDNIEFLMVNAMALQDTPSEAQKYIDDNNFTFPWHHDKTVTGKASVTNLFRVGEFPTTIILDKWGYIAYEHSGTITKSALLAEIAKVRV